ncbi:DUF3165 domain-containing protein [Lactococcus garvieae]|uniref:DUF3165 domain-containing protein n=1 Tax=Lactococcus garvieae TaxID=1363 RepID=A0AA46YTT7_9LACT|nr:DUF3165 domain-containing protein [Lactococcus garvieae]UYT10841.1 DUF3165 domain-containing protein [Lactococcus garvieae]UYT12093.1 DUF3165 domain-containing protein [Lactococcus garvieae]
MFYLILLVLFALGYIFLMPKDVRRSTDIFVLASVSVLIVAVAIGQAVSHRAALYEIAMVIALLALAVKALVEIEKL